VPLFDSGWHEGRLYYVMPCIDGPTLRAELEQRSRFSANDALRIIGDVAEALTYAHAMGFVHRDIKPENIFYSSGRALVADFGIARAVDQSAAVDHITEAGQAIGTVTYMSTEQVLGERELDGRSDLYALGQPRNASSQGAVKFRFPGEPRSSCSSGWAPLAAATVSAAMVAHCARLTVER
jgi:serine/threonine-protein kinase